MRRWVFDASPLIVLGKAGLLGLLEDPDVEGVIPEAVAAEVAAGEDGDPAKVWLLGGPPFPVVPAPVRPVVAGWDLGDGESAVISYALDNPGTEPVLSTTGRGGSAPRPWESARAGRSASSCSPSEKGPSRRSALTSTPS